MVIFQPEMEEVVMNDYRSGVREVAGETHWTFWRILPIVLLIIVVLSAIGFSLNSLGLFGRTVVERKVFEQSYQRSEALKSQIATDEATLAEIKRKLLNPNLDANTRHNLEAQASAARIRIETTRRKQ